MAGTSCKSGEDSLSPMKLFELQRMLRNHFNRHRFMVLEGRGNSVGVKPGEVIATNDNGPIGAVACGVTWGG